MPALKTASGEGGIWIPRLMAPILAKGFIIFIWWFIIFSGRTPRDSASAGAGFSFPLTCFHLLVIFQVAKLPVFQTLCSFRMFFKKIKSLTSSIYQIQDSVTVHKSHRYLRLKFSGQLWLVLLDELEVGTWATHNSRHGSDAFFIWGRL
jgi:hypothetical protein